MDLKKKKVIAREFLLFLICIIIGLLTYGSLHSYNFIKNNKVTKLNHQLKIKQAELDSLKESVNLQVDEFGIPIRMIDLSGIDLSTFDEAMGTYVDDNELKKLYNAVSSKFDIGVFSSFRSNMNTPAKRRKFYEAVYSEGFDLGDYNSYEKRLGKREKVSSKSIEVDPFKEFGGHQLLPPPPPKKHKISNENLILDEAKRKQLDKNIREALANGASKKDIVKYAAEFKNKFGVSKQISVNVDSSLSLKDLGVEKSVAALNQKINSLQKRVNTIWFIKKEESKTILSSRQINQTTLNTSLICLASIFGLRYLWYAITWSIKTIKS